MDQKNPGRIILHGNEANNPEWEGVIDEIEDNEEEIEKLDEEVTGMQKDFYGEDFKTNAGYV